MTQGRKRVQRSKNKEMYELALERGIVPIRRRLHSSSYEQMGRSTCKLDKQLGDDGNIATTRGLKTTIIGHSRFTEKLITYGSPTHEIISSVNSLSSPLTAQLGKLGLFGSEKGRRKLGWSLHGDNIFTEIGKCELAFQQNGFGLVSDPYTDNNTVVPHVTVGFIYPSATVKFNEDRLAELDAQLGVEGQDIVFQRFSVTQSPQTIGTIAVNGE